MTQVNISQKNFSGGEISPDLEGRSDLQVYSKGLSTSLNVMCTNKGDLIPRPGTEYVSLTSNIDTLANRSPKKARLIAFKVSEDLSYMLEFTDKRLRIFKDGKVLEGVTDSIRLPQAAAPVRSDSLANMGNVLTAPEAGFLFLRPNKTTLDAGDGPFYFEFDQIVYDGRATANVPTVGVTSSINLQTKDTAAQGKGSSTEFDSSHTVTSSNRFWIHSVERNVIAPSTERGSYVASQICDIVYITDEYENVGIEGAQLNVTATSNMTDFTWVFENKSITYTSGTSTVSSSSDLDYFVTPYSESDLDDIQFAYYGDTMYFAHRDYRPTKLIRTGETNFKYNNFYFNGGPWRESSTYGESWQGLAKFADPSALHPIPSHPAEGQRFPLATQGEVQWDGTGGSTGKNINENGIDTHIFLHENSPSIKTSLTGYDADDSWTGRAVRIRFNIGQGGGRTNLVQGTFGDLDTMQKAVTGVSSTSINNEEAPFDAFTSFDTSTFLWAEGIVQEQRHIAPSDLSIAAKTNTDRVFTSGSPGLLYVGSNSFLAPGDIVELNVISGGGTLPTHSGVDKSATEPNALKPNQFYVHSVYDDTQVYLCDSYAKVNVSSQQFSGDYTSTDESAGTITVVLRKHTNPTRQLRIKINKPFAFTNLITNSDNEVWVWLKASSQTKIGHLFEDPLNDGTGGWPGAICIFDNRLFFASNSENPSMMAASVKGDFENFTPDDGGSNSVNTVNDPDTDVHWGPGSNQNPRTFPTDSFTYSLQEGTSGKILWMKNMPQGLAVATANGIYMSSKPQRNETYGPGNWKMDLISEEGANSTYPEYIDGKLYYINARGDKLLSLKYSVEADAFKPTVESIISEHLFKDGIVDMAFARSPIQVLWLVSRNGDLISGVILDSEEQKAFFNHRIAGPAYLARPRSKVNSIAVIPSVNKDFDQLWLSVERNVSTTVETADTADTAGPYNTLECLTQYSPYLSDTKDFVGLDLSITTASERRRTNDTSDKIVDLDIAGNTSPFAGELKIETESNHGIVDGGNGLITGLTGGLSYLNYGNFHTALNASENNLFYTVPRTDPSQSENWSGDATTRQFGSKHPWNKDGFLLNRTASVNLIGNSTIGTNPADIGITGNFYLQFNGAFFERGLKYAEVKSISGEYSDGVVTTDSILATSGVTTLTGASNTYSFSSNQGFSYVLGYKPEIYFSTLPPVLNNQLGDMDLNYTFLTSATLQIKDSHQIRVRHYGDSVADEIDLVDDIPAVTSRTQDAVRREGRYKVELDQREENETSKLTFYPEAGYPFLIQKINLRGERGTRP